MRTIIKEIKIAKYSELSEEQKLKVLDKLNDINTDHDWCDSTIDDQKTMLNLLGFCDVEINFSGFCSQGDGASFTGKFQVPKTVKELKERLKALKDYAPKEETFNFSELRFSEDEIEEEYTKIERIDSRYYHSNTVTCYHDDLREFVRSWSNQIYRTLEKEYYYLQSREAIEETIEANEYEFNLETLEICNG